MRIALAAAALALCSVVPLAHAAGPDAAMFFRDPTVLNAALSPSGQYVGMLLSNGSTGRSMLGAVELSTMAMKPVTNLRNADVTSARWLSDQRLAVLISNIGIDETDERLETGLYAIDREGGKPRYVISTIPREGGFAERLDAGFRDTTEQAGELSAGLGPDDMLVRCNCDGRMSLTRLNTRNGAAKLMYGPFDRGSQWRDLTPQTDNDTSISHLIDEKGVLRIAYVYQGGKNRLFYLDAAADRWQQLASFTPEANEAVRPLLFLNEKLYVAARDPQGYGAVYRYDLARQALAPEPIISSPGYDVDGAFEVAGTRIIGARLAAETPLTIWYDARMKGIQEQVDRLLPNTYNKISVGEKSVSPFVLVLARSERHPTRFYVFNTDSAKLLRLDGNNPDIATEQTAPRRVVQYPAADGTMLHASLTLPGGLEGKARPMVVLMHATPWARQLPDTWNPESQFLAAQGYVVLQPEPRGTSGYGAAYYKAGWQQWGGVVQEDVAAAVRWAVEKGIADPARVCIAGTQYGGYAAVLATARHPELFRCALSWSPIADPQLMAARHWKGFCECRGPMRELVGNAPGLLDAGMRFARPVLLAEGEEDPQAPMSYALQLSQALKAGNAESTLLRFDQKSRQTARQEDRIAFWNQAASFLARQLR
jgi:dipeptidyl aminopeptidase/acylaminoacyl peptidase